MSLKAVSASLTHVGRVREHNEDSHFCDNELGLYVVADGMGGHAAGEVASAEAVDQVLAMVRRQRDVVTAFRDSPRDADLLSKVHRVLESAAQAATYAIFGMAEVSPDQQGMGTTLSSLLVVGDRAVIAQVGDSRVYLLRGTTAYQVTEDHTLVNLQVKMGVLTPEQAKTARHGHLITRAVGLKDYVEVDIFSFPVAAGDRFLLCSDGLSDYLQTLDEVAALLGRGSLEDVPPTLINLALQRGGKDNVTAVVVEIAKT
jgi:serine/threonine protein phosphatase PrpC